MIAAHSRPLGRNTPEIEVSMMQARAPLVAFAMGGGVSSAPAFGHRTRRARRSGPHRQAPRKVLRLRPHWRAGRPPAAVRARRVWRRRAPQRPDAIPRAEAPGFL